MPEGLATNDKDIAAMYVALELTKRVTFLGEIGSSDNVAQVYKKMFEAVAEAYRALKPS